MKKSLRKLSLNRETLSNLQQEKLRHIGGAGAFTLPVLCDETEVWECVFETFGC